MRSAYERATRSSPSATASRPPVAEEHDNAIQYDYPMFSKPMTGKEFVEQVSGGVQGVDTSRGY